MHLPLLSRLLLLLFQLLILTRALPSAGSTSVRLPPPSNPPPVLQSLSPSDRQANTRQHEAPVSVLDSLDPETAGSFPAVDAKARDPEQPAGMGMRKRAWSLGRMLLPYEK